MISEKFYNYKKFLNILKRLLDVLRCENCEKQAKKKVLLNKNSNEKTF